MSLVEHLPDALRGLGPQGLFWWQWIALPVVLLLGWVLGFLLGRITRAGLGVIARRTAFTWDDKVLERIGAPLTLAGTMGAFYVLSSFLHLHGRADAVLHTLMRMGMFLAFFWGVLRLVAVTGEVIAGSAWAQAHSASRSLVPLGARLVQLAVVAMAVVALMSQMGYPVASLLAGLGIGGLALALAGQKTVENLFGAFSIGVDQPFSVGDFIRVDGVEGTVEAIGLRSTRIRTLDRTIVTLPNGKLAEMRVESMALRDRMRLYCRLALEHGTSGLQMRAVLAGIEAVLRAHPKIWPDNVVVQLKDIGESALDVEVMAWFATIDATEFQMARQDVLLGFMDAVDKAGTRLAYPSRTIFDGNPGRVPKPSRV